VYPRAVNQEGACAPEGVEGQIAYVSPTSRTNRRYVSAAGCLNICVYELHDVFFRNARREPLAPTLDTYGFQLANQPSEVPNIRDRAQVERLYLAEAESLVKQVTGADDVLTVAWMHRSAAQNPGEAQPPSNDVHVDYTAELAEWLAPAALERAGRSAAPFRRFVTINHWRPLTAPPQDWPLALCDSRSARPDEGVAHGILHVDTLPEASSVPEVLPEDPTRPRSLDFAAFRYAVGHRWYYFPDMSPDEVVLFKNSDSVRSAAWGVPHASFKDPTCPETTPRESIEVRILACFR
jgi:hypothetical protein